MKFEALPTTVTEAWHDACADVPVFLWNLASTGFKQFLADLKKHLDECEWKIGKVELTPEHFAPLFVSDDPQQVVDALKEGESEGEEESKGLQRNIGRAFCVVFESLSFPIQRHLGECFGFQSSIRFKVKALNQREQMYVLGQAADREENTTEPVALNWGLVRIGLVELEGLPDPEREGADYALTFGKLRIGDKRYRVLTTKTVDRLPGALRNEIALAVSEASGLTPDDTEAVDFTLSSPSASETSAETADSPTTASAP